MEMTKAEMRYIIDWMKTMYRIKSSVRYENRAGKRVPTPKKKLKERATLRKFIRYMEQSNG